VKDIAEKTATGGPASGCPAPGGTLQQSVVFHTSCSKPLAVGNQFGGNVVVGLSFDSGREVTLPDAGGDGLEEDCVITLQGGEICPAGNKIKALELLYTAEDCSNTSNTQDPGKAGCTDFGPLEDDVFIRVTDQSDPGNTGGRIYFQGAVAVDSLFIASAANAGENDFSSNSYAHVFASQGGALLQSLQFHTSCSQPLNTGDQFGSLVVFGADTTDGGDISLGAEVLFTYQVTNTGANAAITNVVVTDAYGLVPGSPIASIAPGDTVELTRTVTTTDDIVNDVTASAQPAPCQDTDTVTVTVVEPPEPPQECTTKIQAMLLIYTGANIPGPVTVVFNPDRGPDVTYNLPGGLNAGDTLSSMSQNGNTIDALVDGEDELGAKTIITINGTAPDSGIHTSCSANFFEGQPAPLNDPKGDPSPNWFVESFRQK
jgi:hypothetical protein